jgi:hypothetical protein
MSDLIKTREEIKKQMWLEGVRFNVESVEEAEEELINAADYVREVYADEGTIEAAVEAWIEDTKCNHPEFFHKAETVAC